MCHVPPGLSEPSDCGYNESDIMATPLPRTAPAELLPSDPLFADRREKFCLLITQGLAQWRAYAEAFDRHDLNSVQANARAWQLIHRYPEVNARIQELRRQAAAACIVTVAQLVQDWYDIATADVNEIVSLVTDACRHCHGADHEYQWIDLLEYAQAVAKTPETQPAPTDAGGYGYDPRREPSHECPRCFGRGVATAVLHDTDKLSPAARKLYRGVKKTKYGFEIQLEDAAKARDSIGRVLGAFKDGYVLVPPNPNDAADAVREDMTPESATRAYIKLVGGERKP